MSLVLNIRSIDALVATWRPETTENFLCFKSFEIKMSKPEKKTKCYKELTNCGIFATFRMRLLLLAFGGVLPYFAQKRFCA